MYINAGLREVQNRLTFPLVTLVARACLALWTNMSRSREMGDSPELNTSTDVGTQLRLFKREGIVEQLFVLHEQAASMGNWPGWSRDDVDKWLTLHNLPAQSSLSAHFLFHDIIYLVKCRVYSVCLNISAVQFIPRCPNCEVDGKALVKILGQIFLSEEHPERSFMEIGNSTNDKLKILLEFLVDPEYILYVLNKV